MGLGYIGLPTAAILASRGHRVHGVDVSESVVATINRGGIHIVEPELDIVVRAAVESGRLTASTAPRAADVFMICVPTPVHHATHEPDLGYVEKAARAVAPHVRAGNLVILESTSPPGTTEKVVGGALRAAGLDPGVDVHLAYCPERVLPGAILRESVENDRVIGGFTPACAAKVKEFYGTFVQGTVFTTHCRTAEVVKLVENASRDSQIAFANELSLVARKLGVDVWDVIELANRHPRVNILQPGPGVGGHCIAVDPWFLVSEAGPTAAFIRGARERNDSMPRECVRLIVEQARAHGARTVALLGMSYKNDIDDLRESPSVEILDVVKNEAPDLRVLVCEPNVASFGEVELTSFADCIGQADLLAVLVAHKEFREFDWSSLPSTKTVVDFKGVTRPKTR